MRRALALSLSILLFCAGIFCLAQSNAQVPMTGAGLGAPASGFTPSCSQSSTFLAAATGVTLTADKTNYDTLICGLVTDSYSGGGTIFAALDAMEIWAAPTTTNAALINLIQPGTYNGSVVGTPASFTAYVGYTGDTSTFYINSHFNPSTATSPNYTQNSASYGVYIISNRTTNQNWWSVGDDAGTQKVLFAPYSSNNGVAEVNSTVGVGFNVNNATTKGAYNIVRSDSTHEQSYINSGETASGNDTNTSLTVPNGNLVFFTFNTGFGFSGDQMAAGWIGKSLTGVDSCKINNRVNTYMASLASPINVYTNSAC